MLTVTKNGKPLDQTLYTYDESNKVFSSSENGLVVHFDGHGGTFKTGTGCTFKTGYGCTFDTGYGCVIVRRDIFEVIQPDEGITIKLNECQIKGFTIVNNKKEAEKKALIAKAEELSKQAAEMVEQAKVI